MTTNQKDSAPANSVPAASPAAAVAGGIGAMAVCCTLTLLIAAGVLGSLSGAFIGGIAVGAGIAIAATIWITLMWLHRRRVRRYASGAEASSGTDDRAARLPACSRGCQVG